MGRQAVAQLFCYLLLVFSIPATGDMRADLVFPDSLIEPEVRRYSYDPDTEAGVARDAAVDTGFLVSTLLELLRQPAGSCREVAVVEKTREIFESLGKPLDIRITVDDLPERFAKLSETDKTASYCNNGKTAPASGNFIAYIPGNIPAPSWNLSFHLDTNQSGFSGFRREGDILRPAAGTPLGADDKAGIAIAAELIRLIRDYRIPHGDIRIVGLVAEEDSAAGARLIDASAFEGDIVVSIDGTDPDEIGRAAPTLYSGFITVRTRTAHPAEIDKKRAVSACAVGARILHEAGFRPDAHPPGHPGVVLHSYFMSCGTDNNRLTQKGEPVADYQYNTVSPFWTSAWQMRNLEGAENARKLADSIAATMRQVCAEAASGRTPVVCEITGTDEPALTGYVVPEDAAAIRVLKAGFAQTGTRPATVTARQFGAFNGNLVKERFGEEMIILGTGADQIHTIEETVSVSGMERVVRGVLAAMLESWRYRRIED
ncbi:MAG: M20/M25/M40 family metallo-hydrolase [Gammaproteobacteria bacterium]|jgi:di/tripeptidase